MNNIDILGINDRRNFENNAHKFRSWTIIGSYNVFVSSLPGDVFAVEWNDNEYYIIKIIKYEQDNNEEGAYNEIAKWIGQRLGAKKD